jgi:hypothetical protein
MAGNYDPAKTACSDNYADYRAYKQSYPINPIGPGGNAQLTNNNEKGILERQVQAFTSPKFAALGSDHDSQKQGIYRTNSMGDND